MQISRSVMDLNAAPWVSMDDVFTQRGGRGTFALKLLTAPDGKRVGLARASGEGMPHFHTKASSYLVLEGSMELRDRVAGPGTWGIEPYGAIHPKTKFNDVTYGLGMAEGDFGIGNVTLKSLDDIPEWATQAGFKQDDYSTFVDTPNVPWLPFGDGLSIKILYVFDGRSAFASLVKAEAGARLPPRKYVGPSDMYILSGRAVFDDAEAGAGSWIHHPAGAVDAAATFPVETEFLANTYGTILELDRQGAVARAIDGFALRDFAHVRTDGSVRRDPGHGPELRRTLERLLSAPAPSSR